MSGLKFTFKGLLRGTSVEPTKMSKNYSSQEIIVFRARNRKSYYFFILAIDIFLVYFLVLRKVHDAHEFEELIRSSSWVSLALMLFLSWSLGLMAYRLLFDNSDKLVINDRGVAANNF